jgi:hypothetical protein
LNTHLNLYKTYTKTNRAYQLENDLTRALAICLQEDTLFFHEVLKLILSRSHYNQIFESLETEISVAIDIQKEVSKINSFDYIYAVSLSESELSEFWLQTHNTAYDPICDLVISINNIVVIIEAKRDAVDCTAQLYNQILNLVTSNGYKTNFSKENFNDIVTPFDLNWIKLMNLAVKIANVEEAVSSKNRFLSDFIQMVKHHNFKWLPESSISALQSNNKKAIKKRITSAVEELTKRNTTIEKLHYSDRLGVNCPMPWAQEILFDVNNDGDLVALIYPGNTKQQGYSLFHKTPTFFENADISNTNYPIHKVYHIKLTSFQKYFTGLWFTEDKLKDNLYTSNYFHKYTGRKKRGDQWKQLEMLFDRHLNYDWKSKCNWNGIWKSGRNQFDISFGYEFCIKIPFQILKEMDSQQSNLDALVNLLSEIYTTYCTKLIKPYAIIN